MVRKLERTGMLTLMMHEDNRNMLEAALRLYLVLEAERMSNKDYFLAMETLLRFNRLSYKGYVRIMRSSFFLLCSDDVMKYLDAPSRILVESELQYVERRPALPHPDVALSELFNIDDYFNVRQEIEMPQPTA